MMSKYTIITLLFSLFFSQQASPQNELLTLKDAVGIALKRNPVLNQERAVLKQKEEQHKIVTGLDAPEVVYMKEGINKNEANPYGEKRFSVSQSVDFPLSTIYHLKALKEEIKSQQLKIEALEKDVTVEVKSHYVNVVYALHLQKLREQQIKLAKDLYNAVYTKFETGYGNGIDLIKAELQVAEAENDLDDSEKILHEARYNLFKAIGLNPEEQKYTILFTDTLRGAEERISQHYALNNLEKQPMFRSAANEYEASRYRIKEAKSNLLPGFRFDLYKQDYGNGFNYNGFEVGLSIPLWHPITQKGKVGMAKAVGEETLWKQQMIKLDMKNQVEHAWHGYITSKTTIERFQATIQGKAEKLQSLTMEAYSLGEIDLLNLINAQQIYLNSQQRYITALRDYFLKMIALEKYLEEEIVY